MCSLIPIDIVSNHVLKQRAQWKMHMLPDVIEQLRALVRSQYVEADRAISGCGDFRLAPSHASHRLTVDAWLAMTEANRQRRRLCCFRLSQTTRAGQITVVSTDGEFGVTYKPNAGKKLQQRKRPRAERSATLKRSRCDTGSLK